MRCAIRLSQENMECRHRETFCRGQERNHCGERRRSENAKGEIGKEKSLSGEDRGPVERVGGQDRRVENQSGKVKGRPKNQIRKTDSRSASQADRRSTETEEIERFRGRGLGR